MHFGIRKTNKVCMINKQSRTEEATEETPENSIQTKSTKQKTDLIYKIKPHMKSELIIYPYNINDIKNFPCTKIIGLSFTLHPIKI